MTVFPVNKALSDYPYIYSHFPFHISLNQIPRHYPLHRHDFLEFSLVIEGEGYETVNGVRHPMQPGVFTFLMPYQIHDIHALGDKPLRLFNCMFDMELLFSVLREEEALSSLLFAAPELPAFIQLTGGERERMSRLLQEMLEEFIADESGRMLLLKLKLAEVLLRFQRERLRMHGEAAAADAQPVHDTRPIWHVIQHIHTHYREAIQLTALAVRFGFSPSHLSEEIKRHVGLPFVKFLHEVRIRHACSLLASSDMRTLDVALEVGFGSFQSFSRIFREVKGMTPKEYRRQHQQLREPAEEIRRLNG